MPSSHLRRMEASFLADSRPFFPPPLRGLPPHPALGSSHSFRQDLFPSPLFQGLDQGVSESGEWSGPGRGGTWLRRAWLRTPPQTKPARVRHRGDECREATEATPKGEEEQEPRPRPTLPPTRPRFRGEGGMSLEPWPLPSKSEITISLYQ